MHDIGNKILKARKEMKFSREKLASLIDVATSSILRWENGTMTPSFEAVCKLSDALNKPISYFSEKKRLSSKESKMDKLKSESVGHNLIELGNMLNKIPQDIFDGLLSINRGNDDAWEVVRSSLKIALLSQEAQEDEDEIARDA